MDPLDLVRTKRPEILKIAARHGARNVRVFGSVMRGQADTESDIDLLVEFGPGTGFLEHAALMRELGQLLGRRVDVVSERGLRQRVRERVLQEAVPI